MMQINSLLSHYLHRKKDNWRKIGKMRETSIITKEFFKAEMNRINPKKLLNSKWTAVAPTSKEKHFVISEIKFDDAGIVVSCCLEAVMSKRAIPIDWQDLKDDRDWQHGWN